MHGEREINIFTNKMALIATWLLSSNGTEVFSINGLAEKLGLSVGSVASAVGRMVEVGIIAKSGRSTAKAFVRSDPVRLLNLWTENYSITRKARIWKYRDPALSRAPLRD